MTKQLEKLKSLLFAEESVFVVLDGASVPGLLGKLHELEPVHTCMYRGEIEPDLAEVAPYLVQLEPDAPFTDWVLTEGWGNHWGVFLTSRTAFGAVHRHLRKLLIVHDPAGKPLYFRFYDPRVLRVFLPTCELAELKNMFGSEVAEYWSEGENAQTVERFKKSAEGLLDRQTQPVGEAR